MPNIKVSATCPNCQKEVECVANVNPMDFVHPIRCGRRPDALIPMYKFTSDEIAKYIVEKTHQFEKSTKLEIVPNYIEKKRQKPNEPHRSYCSFRIAMSDACTEKKTNYGWYGQIGAAPGDIKFKHGIYEYIINKWKFNPNDIERWMSSYKAMEELENTFGITEDYLKVLKEYARPILVTSNDSEDWIIFAAAAENIIRDMMESTVTHKVEGEIQIVDTYQISKNLIEFLVYLQPASQTARENPYVRQLLLGEIKNKK